MEPVTENNIKNDNLTREEAELRSRLLHVDSYDVHVDLTNAADPSFEAFPIRATVRFTAQTEVAEETFIEYLHHSIDAVTLNGRSLPVRDVVEGSRIRLSDLREHNELTVHGRSLYSRSGEGMHRFIDPQDGRTYLYTQYEPADCRRVFPTFEQPDLKAEFTFAITAPKHWAVASNALVARTVEDPSDDSVVKTVFEPTQRISTYITTLLAGEYHAVSTMHRSEDPRHPSLPVTLYCRQAKAEDLPAEEMFDLIGRGLEFFQDLFDYPYPFPKYDHAYVPEYNLGAMENPGLVTFTEAYLYPAGATQAQRESRANTTFHEMAHMWFGDLVTMRWWSDLWLKESFAEFMGAFAAHRVGGFEEAWVTFADSRKAWAYRQDGFSTTHPVVADIPDVEAAQQNFDGITYAKGASVLKQLVAFVGEEDFIRASRAYFARHAFGTAELADFLAALEEACGRDLGTWARAWLQTSGVSILTADDDAVVQSLPSSVPAGLGRPHRLMLAQFAAGPEGLSRTGVEDLRLGSEEGASAALPAGASDADLSLLNHADLTYAITRIPERQMPVALEQGHTLADPLDRAVLAGALWNAVRDGLLDPREYLGSVRRLVPVEQSPTLLQTALNHAWEALTRFLGVEDRQREAEELFATASAALAASEEPTDARRVLLRQGLRLARLAASGPELARSVAAAAGEHGAQARFRGLEVSDQLAWSARTALAARGLTDREELDRALSERPTQDAQIGHAMAVAALPGRESAEQAWEACRGNELSNDLFSATADGLMTQDRELTAELIGPYFELLEQVWRARSIGMASRFVRDLYPSPDHGQPLLEAARTWLEEHRQAPGALRRLVIENTEDLERALRIRAGRAG